MSVPPGYRSSFEAEDPVEDFVPPALGAIPDYPVAALPDAARALVLRGAQDGLPPALIGGAALAALAGAVGSRARIEVTGTWHERAILWVSTLAPRGAGKSPAQDLALGPIRDHDAQLAEGEEAPTPVRLGDLTLEALARNLAASDGAGLLDVDEIATVLRGLGEYKRGGGGDRGRFLALWSGAPWSFERVAGGGKQNKLRLRIPRPTLVICGGLQPALHELLGGEDDGLRPRWLPHLAPLPAEPGMLGNGSQVVAWQSLLGTELLPRRGDEREWQLTAPGLSAFEHYRSQWKRQARELEAASIAAALIKADVHCARVALVLAEADAPAAGGLVDADVVERAALIVDFAMNCWRALPEQGALALTRRDWLLDRGITRLVAWLEEHGGEASRRDLQRACVAGCRTAADLNALLGRYEATFPGTVTEARQEQGGLATVVVRAPARRPALTLSAFADTVRSSDENPHNHAESDAVDTADTDPADTDPADTADDPVQAELDRYRALLGEVGPQRPERIPIIGDDDFLPHLYRALERELITQEEWHEADRVHRLVVELRPAGGNPRGARA